MICDFAETYHITNYKELPPTTTAALLIGLRDDSRVKQHLSGNRVTLTEALMAIIADRLSFIAWTKTKDAQQGHKYNGKSIYETLTKPKQDKDEIISFDTVEEYDEYMKRFSKKEG